MERGAGFGRKIFFFGRILLWVPNAWGGHARILLWVPNVWEVDGRSIHVARPKENMMKRTLIRYKTKPDMADKNAELIAGVFAELKATKPEGLRYLSLRLDDNTFVHFVESESDSGSAWPPFAA